RLIDARRPHLAERQPGLAVCVANALGIGRVEYTHAARAVRREVTRHPLDVARLDAPLEHLERPFGLRLRQSLRKHPLAHVDRHVSAHTTVVPTLAPTIGPHGAVRRQIWRSMKAS